MRGYAETGGSINHELRKEATVLYNAREWAYVPVRTASTPIYARVLLVRRSALAALPILKNYYANNGVVFPENPTTLFSNGLIFDGEQFVVHRYDPLSGDVVFRLRSDDGTVKTPPADNDVSTFENEGGATPRHTAENWPIGGDKPDVTDRQEGTETIATTSGTLVSAHQTPAIGEHPGYAGRDESGGSDF